MKTIPIVVKTFDAAGNETSTKTAHAAVMMHPVELGACEECGRQHEATMPHDAMSLRYQYRFYCEHNRWPTWADALAHCPSETREAWVRELTSRGIDVNGGAS